MYRDKLVYVKTCITLEQHQKDFLKKSDYNLSKVVQNRVKELMMSEGQDLRSQPTDEPTKKEDSNSG